jgi:hypothetical protein
MHDPSFFEAYCQLVHTYGLLYFFGLDHTPARLASAEAAFQRHFASVQMQVKRILRALKIFITGTSTMMAL